MDGRLAHIAWLLPPHAIDRDVPRLMKVGPNEAEITCVETLPEFRGQGIYALSIRSVVDEARRVGVRRVYMKSAARNRESRAGIENAGLQHVGSIVLIDLPIVNRQVVLRWYR